MEYNELRHFADSWGLVYLVALFILLVLFAYRPGSRKSADEAAQIPFKEDDENV